MSKIHWGTNCMDCVEGLKLLKDESIDLTVTSPPYDNLRKYNAKAVLIDRPGIPLIFSNHADAKVYDYKYDIVIKNNGNFDDFKNKAKSFLISEKILYWQIGPFMILSS